MPITPSSIELLLHQPAALPPAARALFADPTQGPGVRGVYDSAAWYELQIATALPASAQPHIAIASRAGRPVAALPLIRLASGDWQSLTTPYSCTHHPVLGPDLDPATLTAIAAALARRLRPAAALRLDAIPADWPGLAAFSAGLRQGGLIALRFAHFGNWAEAVPQGGWQAYLGSRDGALRETIRRRGAKLARDPAHRFSLLRTQAEIEPGIAAFEAVYAQSWKHAEPHPRFNAEMMRLSARLGLLRLGVLWRGTHPIAAQYWIVADGTASVLKLAHDSTEAALSPGTLLTAWMIRHLLDEGGVRELDFGRGDDPYKRQWAQTRRAHIGLVAANPRHPLGLALILRHLAGQLRHGWHSVFRPVGT